MNISNIGSCGHLVLQGRILDHGTVLAVVDIFIKTHADSLQNAAFRLHSRKCRTDRRSAVYSRIIIHAPALSGLKIRFQFRDSGHIGRRGNLAAVRRRHDNRDIVASGALCRDVKQRYLFICICSALCRRGVVNLRSVEVTVFFRTTDQLRADPDDIGPKLLCRPHNSAAGQIRRR